MKLRYQIAVFNSTTPATFVNDVLSLLMRSRIWFEVKFEGTDLTGRQFYVTCTDAEHAALTTEINKLWRGAL